MTSVYIVVFIIIIISLVKYFFFNKEPKKIDSLNKNQSRILKDYQEHLNGYKGNEHIVSKVIKRPEIRKGTTYTTKFDYDESTKTTVNDVYKQDVSIKDGDKELENNLTFEVILDTPMQGEGFQKDNFVSESQLKDSDQLNNVSKTNDESPRFRIRSNITSMIDDELENNLISEMILESPLDGEGLKEDNFVIETQLNDANHLNDISKINDNSLTKKCDSVVSSANSFINNPFFNVEQRWVLKSVKNIDKIGFKTTNKTDLIVYYLFDYISNNALNLFEDFDIFDDYNDVNNDIIYPFKSGEYGEMSSFTELFLYSIAKELPDSLNNSNFCLAVVPASNQEANRKRFETFCEGLSSKLGVHNYFNEIWSEVDRENTRKSKNSTNVTENINVSEEFYGKNVLLFDDVSTKGTSMREFRKLLLNKGAHSVFCMTIANTLDYRKINPNDYNFNINNRPNLDLLEKIIDEKFDLFGY